MDGYRFRVPRRPLFVGELLFGQATRPPPEDTLELHASWHHLHHALSGEHDLTGEHGSLGAPLAFLLCSDLRFGPERTCTGHASVAVAEVAEALGRVTPEDLRRRCDPSVLRERVYRPQPPEVLDELLPRLQRFVAEAARRRMPLIRAVLT